MAAPAAPVSTMSPMFIADLYAKASAFETAKQEAQEHSPLKVLKAAKKTLKASLLSLPRRAEAPSSKEVAARLVEFPATAKKVLEEMTKNPELKPELETLDLDLCRILESAKTDAEANPTYLSFKASKKAFKKLAIRALGETSGDEIVRQLSEYISIEEKRPLAPKTFGKITSEWARKV
jgi:hypothetical protein